MEMTFRSSWTTKQVALLDEKPEIGASSTFVTVVDEQGEPLDNQASQGRLAHFNAQNRSHEENRKKLCARRITFSASVYDGQELSGWYRR